MLNSETNGTPAAGPRAGSGWLARWHRTPLYVRILGGLILGVLVGVALGPASTALGMPPRVAAFNLGLLHALEVPSKLILRLLGALAPPLILMAVVHALMTAEIKAAVAGRLVRLLVLNTLVAIIIGLLVANVVKPGRGAVLIDKATKSAASAPKDPLTLFLDNVPRSVLGPFGDEGKILSVIMIALAFGIALRKLRRRPITTVESVVTLALEALLTVLHWIIDLVPIGVFGIVAGLVGVQGLRPFQSLAWFIVAVILALTLQSTYYLLRIRFGSWVRPGRVLTGTRDALTMAFSTASSTISMPVTYSCLREKVGLREESASLGALVGANFNNDGTALYEAMAALFVSQMLDRALGWDQQLLIVLTSVVASVGAAGIPEAGLVTMTLVFTAVSPKLPVEYIALLLPVDWFLDRCRTTINVLGDINVSCLLDGKVREEPGLAPAVATAPLESPVG